MEDKETIFAKWEVDRDKVLFVAFIATFVLIFLFAFSFWAIYIYSKSTNIVFLVIPVILFLLSLAAIPELFKSLKAAPQNSEVYVTDKGVYRREPQNKEYKFIPWGQMNGYDMHYLSSTSPLGRIFIRPTQFVLKSKYEEDNFVVEAFGENVDVLRAYLKENNVPFGFLRNS